MQLLVFREIKCLKVKDDLMVTVNFSDVGSYNFLHNARIRLRRQWQQHALVAPSKILREAYR